MVATTRASATDSGGVGQRIAVEHHEVGTGLRSAAWVSTTGIYGQCCCAIWPARRSGAAIRTLALTYVEMALVQADRLTATERAMASTVRGRPGRTHGGFS
jgi:hypothetical protein